MYSLAQIGLLFSLNMGLGLPVRLCMRRAAGMRSHRKIAAVGCILAALIGLLYLDSAVVDYTAGDEQGVVASTVSTVVAAMIWISAFTVSWKPFLDDPGNRLAAASISLALVSVALVLFFAALPMKDLFGGVGFKFEFAQFALACISMSSAVSSFIVQWDARRANGKPAE